LVWAVRLGVGEFSPGTRPGVGLTGRLWGSGGLLAHGARRGRERRRKAANPAKRAEKRETPGGYPLGVGW
jgi:hypothetical protein